MRRRRIGCTGRGRNVAISDVNVANTVTAIAAADAYRSSLTIQHKDATDANVPVWISRDPAMVAGSGFYLAGQGHSFSVNRENGSTEAWYGISPGNTVTVVVATGER